MYGGLATNLTYSYIDDPSPCISQGFSRNTQPRKRVPKIVSLTFTALYRFVDGLLRGQAPPYPAATPEQATRNHSRWQDMLFFDVAFRSIVTRGTLPLEIYDLIRQKLRDEGHTQSPSDAEAVEKWEPKGPLLSNPLYRTNSPYSRTAHASPDKKGPLRCTFCFQSEHSFQRCRRGRMFCHSILQGFSREEIL